MLAPAARVTRPIMVALGATKAAAAMSGVPKMGWAIAPVASRRDINVTNI
jgi:hypothetical protein